MPCQHCNGEVDDSSKFCSFPCKKAAGGEKIPCRWCDDTFQTVGRYRYHIEQECREASDSFRQQRSIVLDRDGHTCVACGEESGRLEVHHVLRREFFEHEENSHWPGNMVTLCKECHSQTGWDDPVDLYKQAHASA